VEAGTVEVGTAVELRAVLHPGFDLAHRDFSRTRGLALVLVKVPRSREQYWCCTWQAASSMKWSLVVPQRALGKVRQVNSGFHTTETQVGIDHTNLEWSFLPWKRGPELLEKDFVHSTE